MYKVLIADDNSIIREALKKFVNWREIGFAISGEACNGAEALEVIRHNRPDAMLLDIRMPTMSGLELMDRLKSDYPQIRIVILSAHDEFAYATKALQHGAVDYVLKPFDKDKIRDIFARIRRDLDDQAQARLYEDELTNRKYDQIFFRLMQEPSRLAEDGRFGEIGFGTACGKYALFCIRLQSAGTQPELPGDEQSEELRSRLRQAVRDSFGERFLCRVYFGSSGNAAVLAGYNDSGDEAIVAGRRMIEAVSGVWPAGVKVFYRHEMSAWPEIPAAYRDMQTMFGFGLYYKSNHLAEAVPAPSPAADPNALPIREIANKTMICAAANDYDRLFEFVESIFAAVKNERRLQNSEIYTLYTAFVLGVQMDAEQKNGTSEAAAAFGPITYEQFRQYRTIEEIEALVYDTLRDYRDMRSRGKPSKNAKIIEAAKQFLLTHYNEEVSLEQVARHLFIHPIYFCSLFKKETGETYNHYLTQIRLDKAFELLRSSDLRVQEVSAMVGYKSPKHFTRLFKKQFGVLPKDYRDGTS